MTKLSALTLQRLIGLPFLVLGGWALLAPGMVLSLGLRPEFAEDTEVARLLMACFGAQAVLCAIFILTSRFTRWSFLAYGLALLPFFWFNYHFTFVRPIFNWFMAIDFLSNLAMLWLCILGWRAARAEGL